MILRRDMGPGRWRKCGDKKASKLEGCGGGGCHSVATCDHYPLNILMEQTARNRQLLTSLRESIIDKPPYISGTLDLPNSDFSLFYKVAKDDHAARFIISPSWSRGVLTYVLAADTSTLRMLLLTSWNSLLKPVNQPLSAREMKMCSMKPIARPGRWTQNYFLQCWTPLSPT